MAGCREGGSEERGEPGQADAAEHENEGRDHIAADRQGAGEAHGRRGRDGAKVDDGANQPARGQGDRKALHTLHAETERQVGFAGFGDGPGVRAPNLFSMSPWRSVGM